MRHASSLLVAFSTLVLAACGTEVDQSGTTTTGAGGATVTSTSGTGGATTSTTTTTTGTGGAPHICGGKVGTPCGPDEFCKFDPGLTPCGFADGTGTCQPKPQGCTADCPGVCGCDGNFYCNACGANAAGVDVNPDMTCTQADDVYRAVNMITSVPRFAILKASPSRNLCFRLMVMPSQSTGLGIFGDGWTVMSAEVTSDVHDCDFGPGWAPPPVGDSFQATGGAGALTFVQSSAGCVTGIQAEVAFAGAPAWATPAEGFSAQALTIEGGCP